MRIFRPLRRSFASLALVSLVVVSLSATALAASDISGSVSQSYDADAAIQVGMIVQLKAKNTKTVMPLTQKNIKSMLGIVVPVSNAPIVLAPESTAAQQVLVATSGRNDVLVSNQNGVIKPGDYLTISALDGVAMLADTSQSQVVGKAAGTFDGRANVIGSTDLKDTLGRKKTVQLGRIPLEIDVNHNPLFSSGVDHVPSFLGKVATGVSSKPVSAARIYVSLIIFVMTAIVTGTLLYSGVRNGMQAVGRNPLSRKSIGKSLIQTVIAGLIIFLAGIFAVYLLLKL